MNILICDESKSDAENLERILDYSIVINAHIFYHIYPIVPTHPGKTI